MVGLGLDIPGLGHDWTCYRCHDHWIAGFYSSVDRFLRWNGQDAATQIQGLTCLNQCCAPLPRP